MSVIFRRVCYLVAIIIALCQSVSNAQAVGDYITTTTNGNWDVRANWGRWNGGAYVTPNGLQGYPGELAASLNANVIINRNFVLNISLTTALRRLNDITITDEAILTTDGNPALTINGDIVLINTNGVTEPSFCVFGNGALGVGGNMSLGVGCDFTYGTGTCTVSGNTLVGVAGTFTNGGTFTSPGTVTVQSFFFSGLFANNNIVNLTNTAAAVISGGGVWTQGNNSTLNYAGSTLTVTTFNASATGNTVNYNSAANQTIRNPAASQYFHLNLTNDGIKSSSNNHDINGNLTIANDAQMDVNAGTDNLTLAGNWNVTSTNANPFIEGVQTVTFDGAAQTITTVLGAGETFFNVNFQGYGVKSSANIIDINGDLTISGTAQLDVSNNIRLAGDWTVTSTNADPFVHGTGAARTVTLDGTVGAQVVSTTQTGGETFNILTLNNTFATIPQLTFTNPVTVNVTLNMTSGVVNLNSTNFTLGVAATASTLTRTGSLTTNWMYGGTFRRYWPVGAITNTNYGLYPLGTSVASSYRPFLIASATSPTGAGLFSATHTPVSGATDLTAPGYNDGGTFIVRKDNSQFVTANAGVAGGTYNISATMTGLDPGVAANIRLAVNNGAATVTTFGTNNGNSGSAPNPTASRNAVPIANMANDWRITTTNSTTTPLPVELVSFAAAIENDETYLMWRTATELNNDFFTIERAQNLEKFDPIGLVEGHGTTNQPHDYTLVDPMPIFGRSYYRLKQTDFDGKSTYSNVVVVDYEGPRFTSLHAYPNPSNGQSIAIRITGLKEKSVVPIQIISTTGQIVYENTLEVETTGTLQQEVTFNHMLNQGVYIIRAGKTIQLTQKLIVE